MTFMPGRHLNFVGFHLATQGNRRFFHDTFAKVCGHGVGFIDRQVYFDGDLLIGEVQTHQVQMHHSGAEGQMPALENGARQMIKLGITGQALVPLPITIAVKMSPFEDLFGVTLEALDVFLPAQVTDDLVTLRIINQLFQVDHANSVSSRFRLGEGGFHSPP
jgi:hypothetical protein